MISRAANAATELLRVDPIACDGRGLCAEMLPELITPDDWGFPIIRDDAVPAHLLGDARATIRACPKLALRLEHRRGGSRVSGRPALGAASGTGAGRQGRLT